MIISCGAETMNVALAMKVLQFFVPTILFIVTMVALTLFTDIHWIFCVILGVLVGLLDVVFFAPMIERSVSKQFEE